jgi:hypothetical protein
MVDNLGANSVVFTREKDGARMSLTDASGMNRVSHSNINWPSRSPRVDASMSPVNANTSEVLSASSQPMILGRNLKTASTWTTGPPGLVTGNTKKNQYEVFEESAWSIVFKDVQEKNKVGCRVRDCVCVAAAFVEFVSVEESAWLTVFMKRKSFIFARFR